MNQISNFTMPKKEYDYPKETPNFTFNNFQKPKQEI
jgi:hypothetical protein